MSFCKCDGLPLSPPHLSERLCKHGNAALRFRVTLPKRHKQADLPHPIGLLRVRGEWPCSRQAAEHGDELASFQLIELHSMPASQGGTVGYRIDADQSAGIAGILQPLSG